eukprot:TRINITY_DN5216_c0_g1_i2.p2 TRINITY_DN5216_c0_g1~~TRINITY_DN5216_c0_g1_i2.p2  ORF type:complete len:253 (-),score=73.49 TRINITY_DN5216_c0_g1_i2:376-1134(-)
MKKGIVHGLLALALKVCEEGEDRWCAKAAVKVLYGMAAGDRVRCQVPRETTSVCKRRRKFSSWGGLIGLYYLSKKAVLSDVKEFLQHPGMKELILANSHIMLETLRKLSNKKFESMEGINQDSETPKGTESLHDLATTKAKDFCKYHSLTSRPLLAKLSISEMTQELNELVRRKEAELAKKFYEQEIAVETLKGKERACEKDRKEHVRVRAVRGLRLKESAENERGWYRKDIRSQEKMGESLKNYVCFYCEW